MCLYDHETTNNPQTPKNPIALTVDEMEKGNP